MSEGEIKDAVRRAMNILDVWVEVTGAVQRHAGYYYELQGIVEDAVHCGAQAATGDYRRLDGETGPVPNCPPVNQDEASA
jgi:hypothetical protein